VVCCCVALVPQCGVGHSSGPDAAGTTLDQVARWGCTTLVGFNFACVHCVSAALHCVLLVVREALPCVVWLCLAKAAQHQRRCCGSGNLGVLLRGTDSAVQCRALQWT
jgi:hypothetical protein